MLSSARDVDLADNSFTGSVPSELGLLPSLYYYQDNVGKWKTTEVNLRRNRFTGLLPTELLRLCGNNECWWDDDEFDTLSPTSEPTTMSPTKDTPFNRLKARIESPPPPNPTRSTTKTVSTPSCTRSSGSPPWETSRDPPPSRRRPSRAPSRPPTRREANPKSTATEEASPRTASAAAARGASACGT